MRTTETHEDSMKLCIYNNETWDLIQTIETEDLDTAMTEAENHGRSVDWSADYSYKTIDEDTNET
jgi:hypothetical protein